MIKSSTRSGGFEPLKVLRLIKTFLIMSSVMIGAPDIIIDDGSHLNEHVIESFRLLFPSLAPGGLYVVEDTQTSYLESKGGSSRELDSVETSMGLLKRLSLIHI